MNLAEIRKEYLSKELDEKHLDIDPINQLKNWLSEAIASEVNEPTAMNIATVSIDGQPSARIVLLKGLEDGLLKFFTNYSSKKGEEMVNNPKVAITFFWPELERQIRIEGLVSKLPAQESDEYFFSRPVESQIGAIASPQSHKIADRSTIENKIKEIQAKGNESILRPLHWGGYGVQPQYFEFWQGRASRLHDRLVYELEGNQWSISRVAP